MHRFLVGICAVALSIPAAAAGQMDIRLQARVEERCSVSAIDAIPAAFGQQLAIRVSCNVPHFMVELRNGGAPLSFSLAGAQGPVGDVSLTGSIIASTPSRPGRYVFVIDPEDSLEGLDSLQVSISTN